MGYKIIYDSASPSPPNRTIGKEGKQATCGNFSQHFRAGNDKHLCLPRHLSGLRHYYHVQSQRGYCYHRKKEPANLNGL